ncbi:MAG: rod shape-determining protein MreC [Patescibacteria group bacterium]
MYQIGQKKKFRWWLIVIVTLGLLIFLYFLGVADWFLGVFARVASPFQGTFYQAGITLNQYQSKEELARENAELKQQLEEISLDTSQLRTLEVENQILRQQLNFVEEKAYNFVTARVISATTDANFAGVIINRGADDGIKIGVPAIVGDGIIVGKIVAVQSHTSILMFLTDNESKVASTIQNLNRTVGVVIGEHSLSIKMEMIPKSEEIQTGDLVVTSGLEGDIPAGLLIGSVIEVDSVSSELFSTAYLKSLVNYRSLTFVTILLP